MNNLTELWFLLLGIVLLIIIIPLLIGILVAFCLGAMDLTYYLVVIGISSFIWLLIGLYYYK